MFKHYSIDELDQYRHRCLSWLGRIICRIHLWRCPRCRRRLYRLSQDDLFIQELKQSVKKLDISDNPIAYQRLCDIFHDNPQRHSTT